MQQPRNPTISGLHDFMERDILEGVFGRRSWRNRLGMTQCVLHLVNFPGGTIIDAALVDRICADFKAAGARRYNWNTIQSYNSCFRTSALLYHRWFCGEPEWYDLRTTRAISTCDTHTDPVFYGANLVTYHLRTSENIEVTLKLPTDLKPADVELISAFVGSLVYEPSPT